MRDVSCGILLAAGYGRRFDPSGERDKLLESLADGRPVVWHSARALCAVLPETVAVLRPGSPERARWLHEAGCTVLEAPEAERGMGAALAAAVRSRDKAAGWVVALADMPWLPAEMVARVLAAIDTPEAVAAPECRSRRGHPVGFGSAWGARLMALDGDAGARGLLQGVELHGIATEDDGVLRDIDRPMDLPSDTGGVPD